MHPIRRYLNILREAPIADLQVHGMDRPGTFPTIDRNLLSNPKHIQRIRKSFEKSQFIFNLYFVNLHDRTYIVPRPAAPRKDHLPSHKFSDSWRSEVSRFGGRRNSESINRLTGLQIADDPSAISVVFLSNANVANTIPMTPWMVAHRFAHSLSDAPGTLSERAKTDMNEILFLENELRPMLTMRSGREGGAKADLFEELTAQYLITGHVTLSPPRMRRGPRHDPEYLHYTQKRADFVNMRMQVILTDCVGYIFVTV